MPNLNPPSDSPEHLKIERELIEKDAVIPVYPYACITKGQKGSGELVNFEALAEDAVAFSDDGRGVQSEELMRRAMQKAAALSKIIAAHCEDDSLLKGRVYSRWPVCEGAWPPGNLF